VRALALVAGLAVVVAVAGCGGDEKPKTVTGLTATMRATTPSAAPAARAFRAHVDAAVTALRDGIEQPYRAGAFEGDPIDVVSAFATAGTAASTAVKELTAAVRVASGDGGLPELAAQAQSVLSGIPGLIASARDGNLDTDELTRFLDDLDALGDAAAAGGLPVPSTSTETP
jgi:hypothetical protein